MGKALTILFLSMIFLLPVLGDYTHAEEVNQLIIINKSTNKLGFFVNGKLTKTFSVGTGRKDEYTPEGSFKVVNKIKNRPYYTDKIPGGDPRNPLGDRWLGLNARGTWGTTYAIHGNANSNSIGNYVSAGCVRMYNEEVRWLYDNVKVDTPVVIAHFDTSFEEEALAQGYEVEKPYEVYVNGEVLSTTLEKTNIWFISLREVLQPLGYEIGWDENSQRITVTSFGKDITAAINEPVYEVNNKSVTLSHGPLRYQEKTMLPLEAFTVMFGATVKIEEVDRRIVVKLPIPEPSPIKVILNDEELQLEVNPELKNDSVFLPMRAVFEALGTTVQWDDATRSIKSHKGNRNIEFSINKTVVLVNDLNVALPYPPYIKQSRTMIPLRAITEGLGMSVQWDDTTRSVNISE